MYFGQDTYFDKYFGKYFVLTLFPTGTLTGTLGVVWAHDKYLQELYKYFRGPTRRVRLDPQVCCMGMAMIFEFGGT